MKDAVRILSRAAAKCHPLASVDPNILHAKAPRILFSGQSGFTVVPALSSGTDTSPRSTRKAAFQAVTAARALDPKASREFVLDGFEAPSELRAASEGATLAMYAYPYKAPAPAHSLTHSAAGDALASLHFSHGCRVADAQNLAKTLMSVPSNIMTPSAFSKKAEELLHGLSGVTCTVRDEAWIRQENMNLLLAVSAGSVPGSARFLEMTFSPPAYDPASGETLALLGKGVTFDSGGLSLKPSAGMHLMKGDMGGAAIVLAAFYAHVSSLDAQNSSKRIVACIPLCENMVSDQATRPGDVVTSRNGKTVEIDNTDAEGRLILADAISYMCQEYSPRRLVEFSTLTGAISIALGSRYSGLFTRDDALADDLIAAGLETGDELFWRMPMDQEYLELLKSDVADFKNAGGREAGSSSAAVFLQQFVPEGVSYAHVDIAGVMHAKGTTDAIQAGMTGRPTRALLQFLEKS